MRWRLTVALSLVAMGLLGSPSRNVVAGANTWTTNGPPGGEIRKLVMDPSNSSTLYASAFSNLLFKTTDAGAT